MAVTRVAYVVDGWGEGELWFEGPVLVWHELPQPRATPQSPHPGGERTRRPLEATLPAKSGRNRDGTETFARRVVDRVERYFAGEAVSFKDIQITLDGSSPFQRAITSALRGVAYGNVVSYGDLARAAGYPNAQRAAGTFCAHNRFPLVLPCHRVVAANGLGAYGSLGIDYKRRLLELEGVAL